MENSRNNRRQVWLESSERKENSGRWKGGGTKKPDILRSVYNGKDFGLYSNVMINNRGKKITLSLVWRQDCRKAKGKNQDS